MENLWDIVIWAMFICIICIIVFESLGILQFINFNLLDNICKSNNYTSQNYNQDKKLEKGYIECCKQIPDENHFMINKCEVLKNG
jgi:hypothetical protein